MKLGEMTIKVTVPVTAGLGEGARTRERVSVIDRGGSSKGNRIYVMATLKHLPVKFYPCLLAFLSRVTLTAVLPPLLGKTSLPG